MKISILLISLLISFSSFSQNENAYSDDIETIISEVEKTLLYKDNDSLVTGLLTDRMTFYNVPAISVAVVKDYKLHWARAYGWADKEDKRKATTKTLFQAASISKSLNAIGVLHWAETNTIDINKDFSTYTDWDVKSRKKTKGKPITIANILSHTSGLSGHGFNGYEMGEALPSTVQILNGKKPTNSKRIKVLFEPGLKFKYSGGGTTITQLILSQNVGISYDDYMKTKILEPMGMTDSFFTQPPKNTSELATAYWTSGNPLKGKYHVYPEMAAAGLWTNPIELSYFMIEQQKSLLGESNKLLSQEMTKLMTTPFLENGNTGLGVFFETIGEDVYFTHGGSNEGFRCMYLASKENGRGIIVMVNSESFDIIPEIIRSVLRVYKWADI